MSRARRGTGEQAGDSFACLRSSPATVRARHFRPAAGRTAGRMAAGKRSAATALFCGQEMCVKNPVTTLFLWLINVQLRFVCQNKWDKEHKVQVPPSLCSRQEMMSPAPFFRFPLFLSALPAVPQLLTLPIAI